MSISSSDYEKLGQFYLGREYDQTSKKPTDDLVLYDSKDLVTHGVVLGMTGSGKTGLCLAAIEEAAMDNIPAIIIDPKGDISNLLLTFPNLSPEDFRPWINEDDAAKKGISPDEFAAQTAEMWKKGLADWGQTPERIQEFRSKVDITLFTPGSKAGIPVSILASLEAPSEEVLEDSEVYGERVESTVQSLLSLVGVDADPIQSPEAVLLAAIFQNEWKNGRNLTLEGLIALIQKPGFDKVGVLDLESFYSQKNRQTLALKFNNLVASPGFASWLEGPPLDIGKMLRTDGGKPRLSIFSIAHLGDAERMFFVSLLLNQTLAWMRTQNGTTSLRALLYMDEIYGYLPPTANPPSKKPLMTLLKQGRAFGLGCLLATQNPVDLDYKALSNIGTWFLGRLQTERDKLRVLDGLEGAAGAQNMKFDRNEMEKLLSALGNRVFLMNNVHEDHPVLFQVRWAMSYLTGPLTRAQIKTLMDPRRAEFANASGASIQPPASDNPMAAQRPASNASSNRPAVGVGVVEKFAPCSREEDGMVYRPNLLKVGVVHFTTKEGDYPRSVRRLNELTESGPSATPLPPPLKPEALGGDPASGVGFSPLPGYAMNAANYKQVEKDFADELYRNERLEIFTCEAPDGVSKPGEAEADFRQRLAHESREARDAAVEKIRQDAAKKVAALESKKTTAEGQLAKQKAESQSASMQAGASVLGGILSAVLGRKSGISGMARSGTSAFNKASGAYKQHQDVTNAEAKVDSIQGEIDAINQSINDQIAALDQNFSPTGLKLDTQSLKPAKTDVKVQSIALLWLPYDERGDRAW
ncbi:MAG: DUF87 domain-containing protein [Luteolibacter sp.]